eukprot:EC096075.1.p2 GENE.EC096075.1~~EC096075.1.p2  ORF type:complete len:161 (+),score=11.69 EC096075.1:109-591(+)
MDQQSSSSSNIGRPQHRQSPGSPKGEHSSPLALTTQISSISNCSTCSEIGGCYLLEDRWAFWFYSKFSSWGPQLKPLYVVSTNTEFESKLDGMVKPSSVRAKAQLFVMKKGISPDRVDLRNSEGGCWALFIPVDYPNGKQLLDTLWYLLCRAGCEPKVSS